MKKQSKSGLKIQNSSSSQGGQSDSGHHQPKKLVKKSSNAHSYQPNVVTIQHQNSYWGGQVLDTIDEYPAYLQ
jgi:hypothetical protein